MRLSNFKMESMTKVPFGILKTEVYTGSVDVTTGLLWWKNTKRRQIQKKYSVWFFCDTGKYVPIEQIENLERAYEAKQIIDQNTT